jgi:TetR/AcrR family transcriptional repressor of lmrAB and yxaGH operons
VTTLLETAPRRPAITATGRRVVGGWTDVVAGVLSGAGMEPREARSRGQLIIAAMEGALLLARIRRSTRPIQGVAKLV